MSELTVRLFSDGRVSFIRKAINKQLSSHEKCRKQRTEELVNIMSKSLSASQLEKFKAMIEKLGENEFNDVCKKADLMVSSMVCCK